MFLLDTDTSSYVIKRLDEALVEKVKGFAPGELKVSTITAFELEYGANSRALMTSRSKTGRTSP